MCIDLQTAAMANISPSIVGILAELENLGLSVRAHNPTNNTWFIKGEGIFLGYVATSDELIRLKESNRLDLHGIKSLG